MESEREWKESGSKSNRWKKIKGLKKDQLVIFLLFGILLLVIAIPTEPSAERSDEQTVGTEQAETLMEGSSSSGNGSEALSDSYERQQEARLKEVLQKVEGVGKVEVMLTLQASAEKVVEKDVPSSRQTVEESDSNGGSRVTQEESRTEETIYQETSDGSRTPYIVKQLEPKVEGVVIIAEGGGNAAVQQNILEAVQALFSVEAHKIKIMKMEGSK